MDDEDLSPGDGFTPPLLHERVDRFDTCGYCATGEEECGEPATWHIIWTLDAENGSACEKHYRESIARFVYVCAHPRGPDCMMPGSITLFPPENRCIIEGDPIDGPVLEEEKAL